jgi:nitrite reductase/ring-hydroxylating ferredoxin subunit
VDTVEGYFIPSGMYGGHSGYYTWENHCPLCHHTGCLEVNPKGTYEGEITCSACDADYDGCTGYDKYQGGARGQLEAYTEPEPTVTNNDSTTNMTTNTTTPILTPLEKAQNVLMTYKIL